MDGELAYYAALSGLTPAEAFSLADHKFDYFSGVSGLAPAQEYSLSDHMRAYYRAQMPGAPDYFSLADLEYLWFRTLAVFDAGRSIADMKAEVFANPGPPPVPFEHTFLQSATSLVDGTVFSFLAQPIGEASDTRRIVVEVGTAGAAAATTTVTIGGIAASVDVDSGNSIGNRRAWLFSAVVPTGTTADVVVTCSTSQARCGIGMWHLTKGAPTGAVAVSLNVDADILPVATEVGDVVIAGGFCSRADLVAINTAWFTATERFEDALTEATSNSNTGADMIAVGATAQPEFSTNGNAQRAFAAAGYRG